MNQTVRHRIVASACPHDCPSTCALEVEVFDRHTIGRVRGAEDNAYTAGATWFTSRLSAVVPLNPLDLR